MSPTMSDARYNVLTWDCAAGIYSEQEGLSRPSLGIRLWDVRRVLRELQTEFGYPCNRNHEDSDPSVLVERVDDPIIDNMELQA